MGQEILIRSYAASDREAVRRIAVATALMGRPANLFLEGDEILADLLTLYFTDYEPESLFVAERSGEVVGYISGAKDTHPMERVFVTKILGPVFWRSIVSGFWGKAKNWALLGRLFLSFVRGEFFTPDFYQKYPATLHINLSENARAYGAGTSLIETYLAYLKKAAVPGVRMASMSLRAEAFFCKNGFEILFQSPRTYFSHVMPEKVISTVYGKKL
ncbi:MAG: GNAT family N-acetyltransferase [Candidatus Omnitrophica bacterium]|nr:GNAT family N-acetyltransferase [Candidatus Omnitrophota bacterium]